MKRQRELRRFAGNEKREQLALTGELEITELQIQHINRIGDVTIV